MNAKSTAEEVVARLMVRESAVSSHPDVAEAAAGVLVRVSSNLSRFIGNDGCLALLMRARAQAQARHPALQRITIVAQSEPGLIGVTDSIEAYGAAATAAGLHATLVAVIGQLGRLIGDDLTMKLVEQNPSDGGLPGAEATQ